MNRLRNRTLIRTIPALAACALAACTSATAQPAPAAAGTPPPVSAPLTTTLVTSQGSWAVVPMGDPASSGGTFWQVFVQPAGQPADQAAWQLTTPPGVADNGGLVAASSGGELLVGFRPSASLTFSPLAATGDAGRTWTPQVIDAPLAGVPDAVALAPDGEQAALLADSTIETRSAATSTWSTLATITDLAASAPGHACGVRAMSAVSFWGDGEPAAAAECTHPGSAGIFVRTSGGWLSRAPALPAKYADAEVSVLRLGDQMALLRAGGDLLASWGPRVSDPLADGGSGIRASGFGAGQAMWVLLADGSAATISPGGTWQALPRVPAGTAAIVPGQARVDALAVTGATLTVWRLAGHSWALAQTIKVPINYGSGS